MKVAVYGLWHLGTVIAACLSHSGLKVVAVDPDAEAIEKLKKGMPPVAEPGLQELLEEGIAQGSLSFSSDLSELARCDVLWVTFDTPVDDDDQADVSMVDQALKKALPALTDGALVLISSQVPVGFTRQISEFAQHCLPDRKLHFACTPENLRLGKAIDGFIKADRVIVGALDDTAFDITQTLLARFQRLLIRMRPESAEMTKHALNAYLGLSIAFINEVATLCEAVGANAHEVELGLKSDARIGHGAPLSAGGPFAGGTLARDIQYLVNVGAEHQFTPRILASVRQSNEEHKNWALRRLEQELGTLEGNTVAVLGLTYKPGTDTLRRSSALELCRLLVEKGSSVQVHDPAISALPSGTSSSVSLKTSAEEALSGASAAIIATAWPQYAGLSAHQFLSNMSNPLVLDPSGLLKGKLEEHEQVKYAAVGAG